MYVGSSGCSSDLASTVLVDPVLSRMPVDRWAQTAAYVSNETPDTIVVTVKDSTTSLQYTIDKKTWTITRIKESIIYYGYETVQYDGLYTYKDSAGIPVLQSIAFNGDSTFAKGGYRFFNIQINETLPDSLFSGISKPYKARPAAIGSRFVKAYGPAMVPGYLDGRAWSGNLMGRTRAIRAPSRNFVLMRLQR